MANLTKLNINQTQRQTADSIIGPPARGKNFYGRTDFVRQMWQRLERGSNLLLAAPRRFGKSSVMLNLLDVPRDGYKIVRVDVQGYTTAADLIAELVQQMAQDSYFAGLLAQVKTLPANIFSKLQQNIEEFEVEGFKLKLRETLQRGWQDMARELFQVLERADQRIVVMLDELPMMVDQMAKAGKHDEARLLLQFLRSLRQAPELSNVRFIIAGSIGIGRVLNVLGEIRSINDLEQLTLGPFPPSVAEGLLDELALSQEIALTPESRAQMLAEIEIYVPFFLQVLFAETVNEHRQSETPIAPELVAQAYRERVLGVYCLHYFEDYYQRLERYFDPQTAAAAKRILRQIAQDGPLEAAVCFHFYSELLGGEARDENFIELMQDLQHDGYLRYDAETGRYQFALKVLRDLWQRHYAQPLKK